MTELGASSIIFWCLLCIEHSLSPKCMTLPNWSAKTCISICLGFSIYFSINTLPSPKLDFASLDADRYASFISYVFFTILMPFPPPPADALIINGNPISFAILNAWLLSLITSLNPGIVFTLAVSYTHLRAHET